MRKFLILFLVAISLVILNFGLWVYHTRVIRESVFVLQSQLLTKNIRLEYKNINFSNFLAWSVDAELEDVEVHFVESVEHTVLMNEIDITSKVFQDFVKIVFPDKMLYKNGAKSSIIEIAKKPSLLVTFGSSLNTVKDMYKKNKIDLSRDIKNITFDVEKTKIYSEIDKVLQVTLDQASIKVDNFADSEKSGFHGLMSVQNCDVLYDSHNKSDSLKEYYAQQGASSLNLDVSNYQELKSETKTKRFKINKFNLMNNIFNINIDGIINKSTTDLLSDVNLNLSNYKKAINFYIDGINLWVESKKNEIFLPISHISDNQRTSLIHLLEKLSIETEEKEKLKINFLKNGGDLMISGKPIFLVLNQLQALFVSNLQ